MAFSDEFKQIECGVGVRFFQIRVDNLANEVQ